MVLWLRLSSCLRMLYASPPRGSSVLGYSACLDGWWHCSLAFSWCSLSFWCCFYIKFSAYWNALKKWVLVLTLRWVLKIWCVVWARWLAGVRDFRCPSHGRRCAGKDWLVHACMPCVPCMGSGSLLLLGLFETLWNIYSTRCLRLLLFIFLYGSVFMIVVSTSYIYWG